MDIALPDGTELEVRAERDEVVIIARQACSRPFGTRLQMDVSTCEQVLRALGMKLKEAQDW